MRRFSLRDFLWVMALAVIAIAWSIDHRRLTRNALIESAFARDSTIAQAQGEIANLERVRALLAAGPGSAAGGIDIQIAEHQKIIDRHRAEILRNLP